MMESCSKSYMNMKNSAFDTSSRFTKMITASEVPRSLRRHHKNQIIWSILETQANFFRQGTSYGHIVRRYCTIGSFLKTVHAKDTISPWQERFFRVVPLIPQRVHAIREVSRTRVVCS